MRESFGVWIGFWYRIFMGSWILVSAKTSWMPEQGVWLLTLVWVVVAGIAEVQGLHELTPGGFKCWPQRGKVRHCVREVTTNQSAGCSACRTAMESTFTVFLHSSRIAKAKNREKGERKRRAVKRIISASQTMHCSLLFEVRPLLLEGASAQRGCLPSSHLSGCVEGA